MLSCGGGKGGGRRPTRGRSASCASSPCLAFPRRHSRGVKRCAPRPDACGRICSPCIPRRAQGRWLSAGEFEQGSFEQATKGGSYTLHSQSVQALCQKFVANVETATELRRQELAEHGRILTQYPHHPKVYQTVVWKDQALTVLPSGFLRLPVGGQRSRCSCRCRRSSTPPTCVGWR